MRGVVSVHKIWLFLGNREDGCASPCYGLMFWLKLIPMFFHCHLPRLSFGPDLACCLSNLILVGKNIFQFNLLDFIICCGNVICIWMEVSYWL